MRTLTGVLCALVISVFATSATAASQIGFSFGSSDFNESTLDGAAFDMEGESVGFIYRASTPVTGHGGFVGLEMAVAKEFVSAKKTESGTVPGLAATFSATTESSVVWSMDMMPRIGYKFGDVSLSLAAGFSFIQERFKLLGSVNGITYPSLTVKDTRWHTGFKIAPGIDYELSENLTLFGQVQYAKYDSKTYSGPEVSYDITPEMYGVRAGMLFGF